MVALEAPYHEQVIDVPAALPLQRWYDSRDAIEPLPVTFGRSTAQLVAIVEVAELDSQQTRLKLVETAVEADLVVHS